MTDLAARTTWPGILEAGPLGRVGTVFVAFLVLTYLSPISFRVLLVMEG